jgi:hypothetical protein
VNVRPAIAPRLRPRTVPRLDAWERCHALLAWLIGLNIADLVTTHAVLDRGGTESNPLMQGIIDTAAHAWLLKGSCLAVVALLVLRSRLPQRVSLTLGVVNLWYALVVAWNLGVLARA